MEDLSEHPQFQKPPAAAPSKSLAIPYGTRFGLKVDAAKWSLPDDVPASASPQAILAH